MAVPEGYVITEHGLRRSDWPDIASEGPPKPEEVAHARAYLERTYVPAKTAERGSYGLKHEVETGGYPDEVHDRIVPYCSNGALIQAAVELGFRVTPDRPYAKDNINAVVYLKRRK